jgi:sulfite exporter TauE/SafE/copper chaperone CopZ
MKKLSFHIDGTHCASCKLLIEDSLKNQHFVQNPHADIKRETITIETESEKTPEEIASILNQVLQPDGYTASVERPLTAKKTENKLWQALPLGLLLLGLFILLQKSGILNLGLGGRTTPLTSFFIGLIASVSSCLAIVGGLVLSLSASAAQGDESDTKNILLFHTGRIGGFALLGGILGMIGGALSISFTFSAILGLIASFVMIALGLHLSGILPKNLITLPTSIFTSLKKVEHQAFAPLFIGMSTFFLPCGFTQSMQIAALSSGSFTSGFLIMLGFSLGTLPVLSLLSFGSTGLSHSKHAPLFFQTAGIVVLGLGSIALLAGLASLGVITPLFTL